MEGLWGWAALPLAVFTGTVWLTARIRDWLQHRAILDRPVERSSHTQPVPRGGGLAVVPLVLLAWLMLALTGLAPAGTVAIVAVAAALAGLCWRDDIGGLGIGWRLAAHIAAAVIGVTLLQGPIFQGLLPPLLDHAAAVLIWVWFINLYNFMDGIDGITAIETITIGLGTLAAALLAGAQTDLARAALILVAGAAGFLRWNWPKASIFLGDVGSVPLGFLAGWLLLGLAGQGLWASALILALYYLADASITLLRRVAAGERFWHAHRSHFYQRALAPDGDHGAVLRLIIGCNASLLLLALLALVAPYLALALAALATASLLAQLARRARLPARGPAMRPL